MSRFLSGLRELLGNDDRRRAYEDEEREVRSASKVSLVSAGFMESQRELARDGHGAIRIGAAVHDPSLPIHVPLAHVVGTGHSLVLGATNSGKTRAAAGIAREILLRMARNPEEVGLAIVDHKGDFATLVREVLGDLVTRHPEMIHLADRLVVLNPFSATALVPMQILRPEPGIAPSVQAYAVTSLIDRLGGADLGIRQDAFAYHLMLLGITREMTLPEVAGLVGDPASLASASLSSPSAEVRTYFALPTRISGASREGVAARLHRLLRLPAARLMLGAREAVNFHDILGNKILVADLGSPPEGCVDIARFFSELVTLKITRAIFARTPSEATRPVAVFIDEWQEGLGAGSDVVEEYERTLAMARSRGISLWLVSQSLAGAAKVSASLPKIVATNTSLQLLFRASPEDARAMSSILPLTGRRLRAPPPPWAERERSPFLSPVEEREALIHEVAQLPDRCFYLWNRREPHPAVLVRACDVRSEGTAFRDADLSRRLRDGALAKPIVELEREVAQAHERVQPVEFREHDPFPVGPPRRPRRG